MGKKAKEHRKKIEKRNNHIKDAKRLQNKEMTQLMERIRQMQAEEKAKEAITSPVDNNIISETDLPML